MVKSKKGRNCKQVLSCFSHGAQKKGEVTWELVRTILFVVLLVTMVIVAIVLLKGKGGDLLGAVGKILRFGR